ncbi:hypothetical protein [Micromonospora sp. NPDC049282]|uniref:hypothetical protein n=1 Tax=Micromonospora sp. NPDC049282 TaxID=3364269 RepID=UPI00371C8B70
MINDASRWRGLVAEYRALQRLDGGMTPQKRGQRFNGLVADLLTVFGISARPDQRSVGEIDVTFRHGNRPFILEAKWERQKTSTGPIAKLQRRVEQRMVGVTGVFLAMEGYTGEALDDLVRGRRLDIVLLDRSHWEAMLAGFVPPQELLDLVVDAAAFKGEAYTPLYKLLAHKPEVLKTEPTSPSFSPSITAVASTALDVAEYPHLGLSAMDEETALVTLNDGVAAVNLNSGRTRWEVTLSGCGNAALRLPDGSLLLTRKHGIGRYHAGALHVVASGSAVEHGGKLLTGPEGSIWYLDSNQASTPPSPPTLIKVGGSLGDEVHHRLPLADHFVSSAVMLDDSTCALTAGRKVFITPLTGGSPELAFSSESNIIDLATLNGRQLLALDSSHRLYQAEQTVNETRLLVEPWRDSRRLLRLATDRRESVFIASIDQVEGRAVIGVHRLKRSAIPLLPTRPGHAVVSEGAPIPTSHELTAPDLPSKTSPQLVSRNPLVAAGSFASGPLSAAASAQSSPWHAEQERAAADGRALAVQLPLYAIEGLMAANFDVRSWLQPWRAHWLKMAKGEIPPDESLLGWLSAAARSLGAYAAPEGLAEARLRPSAAYLVGFSGGLYAAVQEAVNRKLLEPDAGRMAHWLDQGTYLGDGKLVRTATIRDLEAAVERARNGAALAWLGRGLLWLVTAAFAIGSAIAVHLSLTGGWPDDGLANSIGGVLCYAIPFIFLGWLTMRDAKRLRAKK